DMVAACRLGHAHNIARYLTCARQATGEICPTCNPPLLPSWPCRRGDAHDPAQARMDASRTRREREGARVLSPQSRARPGGAGGGGGGGAGAGGKDTGSGEASSGKASSGKASSGEAGCLASTEAKISEAPGQACATDRITAQYDPSERGSPLHRQEKKSGGL